MSLLSKEDDRIWPRSPSFPLNYLIIRTEEHDKQRRKGQLAYMGAHLAELPSPVFFIYEFSKHCITRYYQTGTHSTAVKCVEKTGNQMGGCRDDKYRGESDARRQEGKETAN